MPNYVSMGRRKSDHAFVVDFHKHRALLRANTGLMEGVYLESIPPGSSGYKPGMVLVHRDWKNIYFLMEQPDWKEDDYFDYAEKKQKELNITKP